MKIIHDVLCLPSDQTRPENIKVIGLQSVDCDPFDGFAAPGRHSHHVLTAIQPLLHFRAYTSVHNAHLALAVKMIFDYLG